MHFFEYANDSRGLYVDFPLSFYNRLNALEKNIHPSLEENRFKYYSASQRLAGETDFNFNDKKYDLFLKLLFRDYKSDEEKFYKSLSKLKECKRMHHTLANFSLIQVVGNMQGFKSKGLRLKNGKHEWLDRLDTFVYMLNDFYRLDNEKRKLHSIIKNAGRYNNELLLYHLNDFNRED